MACRKYVMAMALCALFSCALGEDTSTAKSTTDRSTTEPVTAPPPSTTSTAAPTTTTPSTTPSPAPLTTPAPAPPSDGRGNWTVTGNNVTCIMAWMSVGVEISYPEKEVNKTSTVEVTVPPTAKAEGVCGNSTQGIKLLWGNNSLAFEFGRNDTTKMYFVISTAFEIFADEKTFPNISTSLANQFIHVSSKNVYLHTGIDQSYRCVQEKNFPLAKQVKDDVGAELVLKKVQLQAFHSKMPAVFGAAQDCELDTPDIVPIAVGCALAALVLIVLVAYLVGRRRSQARGYLSM